MARTIDLATQLRNQGLGSAVLIGGTIATVGTAAISVGADTELLSELTLQVDPDNTNSIFFGATTPTMQLAPGQSYTIGVAKVTTVKVKAVGADTNITVNYLGTVV